MSRKFFWTLISPVAAVLIGTAGPAFAAVAVEGKVVDASDSPVAAASVLLAGQNRTLAAATDENGRFAFAAVESGEYELRAAGPGGTAQAHVIATSDTVHVVMRLVPIRSLGVVRTVSSSVVDRSGGSTVIGGRALAHEPRSDSLAGLLVQLPASARASNEQVHVNGDHGNINYVLDGVSLPQSLNRVIGSEIDPSTVGFINVIEGAYPAEYGGKFGAVLSIATVSGTGEPASALRTGAGSYGSQDFSASVHDRFGRSGGYSASLRNSRPGWALDPPVQSFLHDAGSVASQFLRVTLPRGPASSLNVDVSHSFQTFQIPPDTSRTVTSSTDDVETQDDAFVSLQYRRSIGTDGLLAAGPYFRLSHIRDLADVVNDLVPASGNDCATNPGDCVFAASDDRLARDVGVNVVYDKHAGRHTFRTGASYETDSIAKRYQIILQPNNFLQALPLAILDDNPNVGHLASAFVQDAWMMSERWHAAAGVRTDTLLLASTDFAVGFSQTSPRLKVTRVFSDRTSAYAYYGRLFVPFSLENISGGNAKFLNPLSGSAFDLKPERNSLYELGGQFPLGRAQGSWKISHKASVNVVDDGQVGATNIHQDINFAQGAADIQAALLQWARADGGRSYISLTHSRSVVKACGSSLLIDCSAFPGDFLDADHDQRWSATAGMDVTLSRGWLALDAEYGSGLSWTQICDACHVPPHLTFDAETGWQTGAHGAIVARVENLLNDRYAITKNSTLQGTHYARPRTFNLSYRLER